MFYLTGHSYADIPAKKASCGGKIFRGDDYWQSRQNPTNDGDFGFLWSLAHLQHKTVSGHEHYEWSCG